MSLLPTFLAVLAALQLAGGPETTRIHWQRDLGDALAIAAAEGRPLLLAVNMDGESACERIVREVYKDPEFVALTRGYVCLVSSVFRHAPRDHDDAGRRIECPRLGEVTCGEHIALESILYDRFLGGDRIAPRHAVVTPAGEVVFDLSLLFDLDDIGARIAAESASVPELGTRSSAYRTRAHRERLAFELRGFEQTRYEQDMWMQRLRGPRAAALTQAEIGAVLGRPEEHAVTVETLRALLPVQPGKPADGWVALARRPEYVTGASAFLREYLTAFGDKVERPNLDAHLGSLLLLGRVDDSPASVTLLRSYEALPNEVGERALARQGLSAGQPAPARAADAPVYELDETERAYVLPYERELAREVAYVPWSIEPELADERALGAELARVEELLAESPDDPELALRMGRAALGLARRRMESSGGAEIPLLLQDAERNLGRARAANPTDATILLDLARTMYSLSRFEEQHAYALAVWSAETNWASIPATVDGAAQLSPMAVEALRWLGDAAGRLLESASGGDPERELWMLSNGGRAHLTVALSPYADGNDWVSLASYFAALGRWREEAWFAYQGLLRFPDHNGLHQALSRSLHAAGRPDLAARTAERVAWERARSATAHWHSGLQHLLHGDWLRRGEQPERALGAYARASGAFATSQQLEPAFADSADHYIAFAALGRGFAHLAIDRQTEAADALVDAVRLRPAIATLRDGLDREPLDLLDGALEYRRGRVSPVDPNALADELASADPGNDFWPRAVSDSALREALRAEGRGDLELFESYLSPSIEAGQRARILQHTPENRRTAAQPMTILGRLLLARGEIEEARSYLLLAATFMDVELPRDPVSAGADELEALGVALREALGERRPVDRPGR